MYRVEWINAVGDVMIKRGFTTSEAAHDWIREHKLDGAWNCPMVFYDGAQQRVFSDSSYLDLMGLKFY